MKLCLVVDAVRRKALSAEDVRVGHVRGVQLLAVLYHRHPHALAARVAVMESQLAGMQSQASKPKAAKATKTKPKAQK